MTEPDWADEIAVALAQVNRRGGASTPDVAAALRRAKAEGLREAADLALDPSFKDVLREIATQLSPPTPQEPT